MKKVIVMLIASASIYAANAQEVNKQKEIGVTMSSLDDFGFSYKFGNTKGMWRVTTLVGAGAQLNRTINNQEVSETSLEATVKFGREFRRSISDKLEFRYGADLSFGYQTSKTLQHSVGGSGGVSSLSTYYQPGANLILGVNYLISENFIVGAEISPQFLYTTGSSTNLAAYSEKVVTKVSGIMYGLSSSPAMLTFSYRF